jgi:TetR/AcrR family tetracycline transcriptional repressor
MMARRTLTREIIVHEAIQLLKESGLEGLSMRALATRLRVQAPTLYYHIPDKSALLNEVQTTLFESCFDRIGPCATWQEWMRSFGRAIWDVQGEAPFTPELILSTRIDEEHYLRTVARIGLELSRFEADQDRLLFVQSAVQAVVTGWSLFAHAPHASRLTQFVDFREAALDSVDKLVAGWSDRVDEIPGSVMLKG